MSKVTRHKRTRTIIVQKTVNGASMRNWLVTKVDVPKIVQK